jgi:hypothetical protein
VREALTAWRNRQVENPMSPNPVSAPTSVRERPIP